MTGIPNVSTLDPSSIVGALNKVINVTNANMAALDAGLGAPQAFQNPFFAPLSEIGVMGSGVAPTITGSAVSGGSNITSPQHYYLSTTSGAALSTPANFSMWLQGGFAPYFYTGGIESYETPPSGTDGVNAMVISAIHDGISFEIIGRAADNWTFEVDGELAAVSPVTVAYEAGYSQVWYTLVFPTRARRRIVAYGASFGFAGINIGPYDTLEPYPVQNFTMPMYCMTDSYGTLASNNFINGPFWVALKRLGLLPYYISAGGGSGYVATGSGGKNYGQRQASLFPANTTPGGIYLIAGGINESAVPQAAAYSLYAFIRSKGPSNIIVVVGAWAPYQPDIVVSKNQNMLAALLQVPGPWVFLDNNLGQWTNSIGQTGPIGNAPWQTGDGRQIVFTGTLNTATSGTLATAWAGSTGTYKLWFDDGSVHTGTLTLNSTAVTWTTAVTTTTIYAGAYSNNAGNSIFYISQDGTHPTAAGTEYLGSLLADGIQAAFFTGPETMITSLKGNITLQTCYHCFRAGKERRLNPVRKEGT